jgi:hypothetical protein
MTGRVYIQGMMFKGTLSRQVAFDHRRCALQSIQACDVECCIHHLNCRAQPWHSNRPPHNCLKVAR